MSPPTSSQQTFLNDIEVEVQIGLHPWEKFAERPTRLRITVELTSEVLVSFVPSVAHRFIDYDLIRNFIRALSTRPHMSLLEEVVHDILDFCMRFEDVTACRVAVRKPDVFNDVNEAGVEVFLTRSDHRLYTQNVAAPHGTES